MWTHVETVTQSHDHMASSGLNERDFLWGNWELACCGLTTVHLALLTLKVALFCFLKLHFFYAHTWLLFWCMLFLKHYGAPHDGSALVSVSCLFVIGRDMVVANNQRRRMVILMFDFNISHFICCAFVWKKLFNSGPSPCKRKRKENIQKNLKAEHDSHQV